VIVVLCDDSKTAPAYFYALKLRVKENVTVDVVGLKCSEQTPAQVIAQAKSKAKELRGKAKKFKSGDAVWVLIDCEATKAQHDAAKQAAAEGAKHGIQVARSNPCFEIWTLAHLFDTGEAFNDCAAVNQTLRAKWKEQFKQEMPKKSQADYAKLMDMRGEAVKRCKRRNRKNGGSWTEVYKVIEAIEQAAKPADGQP